MQINLAVVRVIMSNEPIHRELAIGDLIVQFDLSTCVEYDGRAANLSVPVPVPVPVAWRNPSAAAVGVLVAGEGVVVTGRVERRFSRSGGLTQTRTELVAECCLPARRTKSVRSLLAASAANLTPWASQTTLRTTRPVRSFGVKKVDFGGISRPSRAVRSISATLTGRMRTAPVAASLVTASTTLVTPCW